MHAYGVDEVSLTSSLLVKYGRIRRIIVIRILRLVSLLLVLVATTCGCASVFKSEDIPPTPLTGKELGRAELSPDGRTIVFSLGSEKNLSLFSHSSAEDSHLYVVNIDGSGLSALTNSTTYDYHPTFSPNGSDIAYSQYSNGQGGLCIIKPDGSGKHCITSGTAHDFDPVYAPDGSKIYFLRAQVFRNYSPIARPSWHDMDIYSIKPDGTALTRVTSEKNFRMGGISINLKGDTLMVTGSGRGGDNLYQIWMIPINDPTNKIIVRPNLEKYRINTLFGPREVDYNELRNARLSPDGTHILFTWPFFGDLYMLDLETSITMRIWKWESEGERQVGRMLPIFSKDGQRIIFSTVSSPMYTSQYSNVREEPKLWIINRDGTGLQGVDIKQEGAVQ